MILSWFDRYFYVISVKPEQPLSLIKNAIFRNNVKKMKSERNIKRAKAFITPSFKNLLLKILHAESSIAS